MDVSVSPPGMLAGIQTRLLPSFMNRIPRDSMSLARREMDAVGFTQDGFPDLSLDDCQRRIMRDEIIQWTWLQARVQYVKGSEPNATCYREEVVAMTDDEVFDYAVLHFFIVHAHPVAATTYMTELGMDGSEYVRPDDPLSQCRRRPIALDPAALIAAAEVPLRQSLREAIEAGNMTLARKVVHDGLGRGFWSQHPELLFRLLLQHFVELVRAGRHAKAVRFAQAQLAPFAEANPGFLIDLEHVFSVLAVDQAAPPSESDPEGIWLLSPNRRYQVFRDINDVILRELGVDPMDMIQNCQYLHAYFEDAIRRIVHAAEVHLAQDPQNQTRIAHLEAFKSWRNSLYSLEDLVQEREDAWRRLMDRVEANGVEPDPHIQAMIERAYNKLLAAERGEHGAGALLDSSVEEGLGEEQGGDGAGRTEQVEGGEGDGAWRGDDGMSL